MLKWEYNPEDYGKVKPIDVGRYRVRIEDAEEATSKSGKQMIKMTLKVSGYNQKLWHYVVLDSSSEEAQKRTNNNLGHIFNSFNIPVGNLNLEVWKGKVGGVQIKHETYNEETQARIQYFLNRDKVDELPAWQEGATKTTAAPAPSNVNPDMVDFGSNEPVPF